MHPGVFAILPFLAGYYLSYFLRTINAVIAPELSREFGLTAGDLGWLTSAYFLAFALAQLPVGMLLDRYGARRTESTLLLLTAIGAAGFALGSGVQSLTLARGLIGFGVSACLMAALKYASQLFPAERQASLTGMIMSAGGLGAVTSSIPMEALLPIAGWRPVFWLLAVISVAVAAYMFRAVRDVTSGVHPQPVAVQLQSLKAIFSTRVFWAFAPAAAFSVGGFMAVQGLWAVPWLMHVHGASRSQAAQFQFVLCLAGLVGQLAIAMFATGMLRRGISQMRLLLAGQFISVAAQFAVVLGLGGHFLPWIVFGLAASTGAQIYSLLASHYPLTLAGRVMTSINLVVFVGAFAVQWGYGVVVDVMTINGGEPGAFRFAHSILIVLQLLGLLAIVACGTEARRVHAVTP